MFLIGVDTVSQDWLRKNYAHLVSINAVGLVIHVNNVEEMKTLRQIAPELTILPSPADALADRLGIYHYPLLLTDEGISQ